MAKSTHKKKTEKRLGQCREVHEYGTWWNLARQSLSMALNVQL